MLIPLPKRSWFHEEIRNSNTGCYFILVGILWNLTKPARPEPPKTVADQVHLLANAIIDLADAQERTLEIVQEHEKQLEKLKADYESRRMIHLPIRPEDRVHYGESNRVAGK